MTSNDTAGRWLRVSTGGQDEINQEPDIDRWIADHGYDTGPTYRLHGKSASKGKQQAALDQAVEDMRAGLITVLVVWQSSRIERRGAWNAFDLAKRVREAGGRIEYVQDAYLNETNDMSDVMLALAASQNRKYSENISKQVTASFATIKAQGGVIGRAGYGFRVTGDTKYAKRMEVFEPEAAVIRETADRYLDGETIDALCDDLNARGVPSPTWRGEPGKHWYAKTLAGLLRSPGIAGRRVDASGKTILRHAEIITWDTHKRLVARLDSRAHRKGISPGNVALLTSVLFDDQGHPLYRIKPWDQPARYYCRKCRASVDLARADARVGRMFERNRTRYKVAQVIPGDNHADEIDRLRQDRAELDDMSEDYDQQHARLTAEIRQLARLDQEHPRPDRIEMVDSGKSYGQVWQAMTTAERRDMLLDARFRVIWHGEGRWEFRLGSLG